MTRRRANIFIMNLRSVKYFLKNALQSLAHNWLMTVAAISTVMISLIILGSFLLAIVNINNLANSLSSRVEMAVYLKKDLDEVDRTLLKVNLLKIKGIKSIDYIPKEIALQKLQEDLGERVDLKDILVSNPLPDCLQIRMNGPEEIERVAKKIKKFSQVEEVVYGQKVLNKLLTLNRVVQIAAGVSIILMGLATLLLIVNTIRLTVFARRKEIRIMQLVGATDWFIRWPYLLEGLIEGVAGASLAIALLSSGYYYLVIQLKKSLPFIPLLQDTGMLINLGIILLMIGGFEGLIGSLIGVGKFLEEV